MDMHLTSPLLPLCFPRLMSTLGLPSWPWESKLQAATLSVSLLGVSMPLQAGGKARGHRNQAGQLTSNECRTVALVSPQHRTRKDEGLQEPPPQPEHASMLHYAHVDSCSGIALVWQALQWAYPFLDRGRSHHFTRAMLL